MLTLHRLVRGLSTLSLQGVSGANLPWIPGDYFAQYFFSLY